MILSKYCTDNTFHWPGAVVVIDQIKARPCILTWLRGAVIDVCLTKLSFTSILVHTNTGSFLDGPLKEQRAASTYTHTNPFSAYVL